MDAKSKANFINSVASGQKIPCPNCNSLNRPDSSFCTFCGTKLEGIPIEAAREDPNTSTAYAQSNSEEIAVTTDPKNEIAFAPIQDEVISSAQQEEKTEAVFTPLFMNEEEDSDDTTPSVFALGLPDWDIVPPQVVVRRKAQG